jgi:hypothetical protein
MSLTQETLEHFLVGMTIHEVTLYEKGGQLHLFVSEDPERWTNVSILTIKAQEADQLEIDIIGPSEEPIPELEAEPF